MKRKVLDCPVLKTCPEFGHCDLCEHGRRYMELRQKLANTAKRIAVVSLQNGVLKKAVYRADFGCEYCVPDDCCSPLSWKYGLDHIFPNYRFCPMCGRDLRRKEGGGCEHDAG